MILIIGYGNNLRQDDGAGGQLAELIEQVCSQAELQTEQIITHQLTPELALDIARPEIQMVIFADTRIARSQADTKIRITPLSTIEATTPVGHHLNPETLLLYSQELYGHRPAAWLFTVPGNSFEHGEGFSSQTEQALQTAGGEIRRWLKQVPIFISK
jgi:hydrogenase maturation protease